MSEQIATAAELMAAIRGQSPAEYRNECGDNRTLWEGMIEQHVRNVRADTAERIAQAIEAVDEREVLDRKDALLMCARIASEQGR